MARARDDVSDFSPKHRIVGAIIVVSLAVIFLPMILSNESPQPELGETASQLSEIPKPEGDTKVLRLPVTSLAQATPSVQTAAATKDAGDPLGTEAKTTDETAGSTVTGQAEAPQAGNAVKMNLSLKELARGDAKVEPSADDTTGVVAKATVKDQAKGWVVQVGTFSNNANAKRLRDELRKSGFLVNLEDVTLKGNKAVRVRVGPYRQKHVAVKAQSKIHQQVGLKGVVLAYP